MAEQGGRFLAPGEVGSAVNWYVRVTKSKITYGKRKGQFTAILNAAVHLTDCDRKIAWGLHTELEKLDEAIAELKALRRALVKARRLYEKNHLPDPDDDDL